MPQPERPEVTRVSTSFGIDSGFLSQETIPSLMSGASRTAKSPSFKGGASWAHPREIRLPHRPRLSHGQRDTEVSDEGLALLTQQDVWPNGPEPSRRSPPRDPSHRHRRPREQTHRRRTRE